MYINNILKEVRGIALNIVPLKKSDIYSKDIIALLKKYNLDEDNIYINPEAALSPYCYIDKKNGIYIEFCEFSENFFNMLEINKRIEQIGMLNAKHIQNEDYEFLYHIIPEKYRYYDFKERLKDIPIEKRYEVFINIYTHLDFSFSKIDEAFIRDIFKLAPKYSDSDKEIIIYRGVSSESVEITKAHSWTTEFSVALKFSTMYNFDNNKVYKAKIKEKDIIDFLEDRNESEVLCNYEDLYDIEEIISYSYDADYLSLLLALIDKDMIKYISKLDKCWFSTGVHDENHTIRVLALSLLLMNNLNITKKEKQIVIQSILLHDIGRDTDEIENCHGKKAVLKIEKENINPLNLNQKDMNICKKIIEYHCIDDSLYTDYKYKKLYDIVKDSDALDRIRIKDLDINNLRYNKSKDLIFIACIFFKYKIENRYK